MRNDLTEIGIVLDASGSMHTLRKDTLGSFNSFLEEQKKLPGEANVTFTIFNNTYDIKYVSRNLKEIKPLTLNDYVTDGMTALYDAVGNTIIRIGQKLSSIDEKDRPSKVMFVILTDGAENYSKEFDQAKIAEMIKHQRETYNWEFIFIGTENLDVQSYAKGLNISAQSAVAFAASADGYGHLSRGLSDMTMAYRSTGVMDTALLDKEVIKSRNDKSTSVSGASGYVSGHSSGSSRA